MDAEIASQALLVFSIFLCGLCLFGILFPKQLVSWISEFWKLPPALYISVFTRLILGLLFIFAAPASKYQTAFSFIGYFTIAAAIIILFVGRRKIGLLLNWAKFWPLLRIRAWLLFGLVFFAFVIYGLL